MSFSLLKCYDRVIERIYSSITLQSWLHEACGFWKKKKWLHRERERERVRILPLSLQRERFAGRLEQIFRDGGGSGCRGGRMGGRGESAIGEELTRPPPSFCVYRDRRPPAKQKIIRFMNVLLLSAVTTWALWSPVRAVFKRDSIGVTDSYSCSVSLNDPTDSQQHEQQQVQRIQLYI